MDAKFYYYLVSVDVDILVEHEDERPPYYDFSSPHLNGLSASQARQRANDLLILFNGTMRANFGADFYNFTIGEGRDLLRRGPIVGGYRETEPLLAFPDDVEDLRYYRSHRELD
jgi:hypothetical protein